MTLNDDIPTLIEALQSEDDQLYALLTLDELNVDIPYQHLVRLLSANDYFMRKLAAGALAYHTKVEDITVVGEHLVPLLYDESASVRAEVAMTLGKLAYTPATSLLGSLLHTDASWVVRCSIAETLGYLDDSSVVPDLEQALDDDNESVRLYAAGSLGLIAPASFAHDLDRLITQRDNSPRLLLELIYAQYRLGGNDSLQQLLAVLAHIDDVDGLDHMFGCIDGFVGWKQPPTLREDAAQLWTALETLRSRFPERAATLQHIQAQLDTDQPAHRR